MGTSTLSHHVIILNPNLNKVKKTEFVYQFESLWGSGNSI